MTPSVFCRGKGKCPSRTDRAIRRVEALTKQKRKSRPIGKVGVMVKGVGGRE